MVSVEMKPGSQGIMLYSGHLSERAILDLRYQRILRRCDVRCPAECGLNSANLIRLSPAGAVHQPGHENNDVIDGGNLRTAKRRYSCGGGR
jgi:hypothetical protein